MPIDPDHRFRVMKFFTYSDPTDMGEVICTHRTYPAANRCATFRDGLELLTTWFHPRCCYDVRLAPRPDPAPVTERWGGPPQ